ncbi:hypothetical protein AKJ16_DCAP17760 [Drosera capensis]
MGDKIMDDKTTEESKEAPFSAPSQWIIECAVELLTYQSILSWPKAVILPGQFHMGRSNPGCFGAITRNAVIAPRQGSNLVAK